MRSIMSRYNCLELYKWVQTNSYLERQLYNTLIPPSNESPAVGLWNSRLSGPVELTLRYTMPDICCRHRRYECDGGIIVHIDLLLDRNNMTNAHITGLVVQLMWVFPPCGGKAVSSAAVRLFICLSHVLISKTIHFRPWLLNPCTTGQHPLVSVARSGRNSTETFTGTISQAFAG